MQFRSAILPLLLSSAALAQTATGRLTGTVLDPTGLPIPNAAVTVKGEETGLTVSAVTSPAGVFFVADLPPVEYSIDVNASGFRRQILRRFKVDVAKENVVPPIRLEIGTVAEAVEVHAAGAGQVQTANAEIAATVTRQQIADLPIVDRDPMGLISLEAGVVYNGRTATVINGQRTSFSNVTLDGINIQDNFIRGNALNFIPNRLLVDEISEFTITTQNGNPALGVGASQVNFITPSGTNLYHGRLYWQNRNNQFAADQWFANKAGRDPVTGERLVPKPFLNVNQGGGGLAGPIIKDKLLFFANYEAYRSHSQALANATILTASARQGIFTYRDAQNRVQRVNVLSAAGVRLDPRVQQLLQRVPGPELINNFETGDSDRSLLRNTAGYRFNVRDNITRDNVTSRLDYNLSQAHLFSGTYRYNREVVDRSDIANGYHRTPVIYNDGHTHFLSAAWRWTPGPTWTNELRGGFNLAPGRFVVTEDPGSQLFTGFNFTNPVVNFRPEGRDTNTFNFMDNLAWQKGNHSLRLGAQFQRIYATPFDVAGMIPTYGIGFSIENPIFLDFSQFPGGISAADLGRAEALLASLGGIISNASQVFNIRDRTSGFIPGQEFRRRYSLHNYSFYGQDSWKLHRKLTLNLGLRWEYSGRFDERDGLLLAPIFTSVGVRETLLSDTILDFAGHAVNRPLYAKDLNNFAPNVGLAFDPFGDGKTSFRAGYTISFVNDELLRTGDNATLANDGLQAALSRTDLVTTMSGTLPSFRPPVFQVPRTASQNFDLNPTSAVFAIDPKLGTPYVQQWTVGLQREVMKDTVVEARYVGNHGTSLLRGFDFNQIIIRENGFLDDFIRARSNGFLALQRTGTFNPAFNAGIPGSQQLTVFPRLFQGGFLTNGTVRALIRSGEPGELAAIYYVNGLQGQVRFTPSPYTFVADLITNYSHSTYNALQLEVRRRSASGVQFQANYSFSKVLADSSGAAVRFEPFLDFGNGSIERSRADFDLTHVFNANFVWPIPVGKGHRFHYAPLDRVIGGWSLGSIIAWQSGAPFSILSGRGTLNRTGRSTQNTAVTLLTKSQLDDIVKFRMTGDGPFMIAAGAINPQDNSGVAADGQAPFSGQVFFHPHPGQIGTLQRRLFSGPNAFAFDLKVNKQIPVTERHQARLEATFTNLFNHPAFFTGSHAISSAQFGRISSVLVGARVIQFGLRYEF
jgi:hypothetical protein